MPGILSSAAYPSRGSPVENIPLQAEHHSGSRQKMFAFPPECCSESQRNGVRLQTGIAFVFDRIPHKKAKKKRTLVKSPVNNSYTECRWQYTRN